MKSISFGWTSPAIRAGVKTVTRRENWDQKYALSFHPGERCMAYTRAPEKGGTPIREIEILSVTYEPTHKMPDADYEREGLKHLGKSRQEFESWRQSGAWAWVVRFRYTTDPQQSLFPEPGPRA